MVRVSGVKMTAIRELGTEDAERVSFPDCEITSFESNGHRISFSSDAIHVDGLGLLPMQVDCLVTGQITLVEWDGEQDNDLDVDAASGLRDICEWMVSGPDLRIHGFQEKSGLWNEYIISSFELLVRSTNGSPISNASASR
jgi:hypothetical protein